MEQISAVAEIVKRCLKLSGEERPTMKEVSMELERLRNYNSHSQKQEEISEGNLRLTGEQQNDLYSDLQQWEVRRTAQSRQTDSPCNQ